MFRGYLYFRSVSALRVIKMVLFFDFYTPEGLLIFD